MTLAHWLRSRRRQRQREKLLMKAGADAAAGRSNGLKWSLTKTVPRLPHHQEPYGPTLPEGAYCQISNTAEVARLGLLPDLRKNIAAHFPIPGDRSFGAMSLFGLLFEPMDQFLFA
jgi:hypothetical protein